MLSMGRLTAVSPLKPNGTRAKNVSLRPAAN
jgi:hypothetical protein